jgi:hypothetical protein
LKETTVLSLKHLPPSLNTGFPSDLEICEHFPVGEFHNSVLRSPVWCRYLSESHAFWPLSAQRVATFCRPIARPCVCISLLSRRRARCRSQSRTIGPMAEVLCCVAQRCQCSRGVNEPFGLVYELLGFWTLSIIHMLKHTREQNVSETNIKNDVEILCNKRSPQTSDRLVA